MMLLQDIHQTPWQNRSAVTVIMHMEMDIDEVHLDEFIQMNLYNYRILFRKYDLTKLDE